MEHNNKAHCSPKKKLQILESELAPHKIIFKQELKINPNNFIILFSGKLIQKKRPLDLLIAFNNANIKNSTLIFLGDGNLKFILQEYINDNNIENNSFVYIHLLMPHAPYEFKGTRNSYKDLANTDKLDNYYDYWKFSNIMISHLLSNLTKEISHLR